MRRAILAGPVLAVALAAPATAAEFEVRGLDTQQFAPSSLTVVVGDTVRWTFETTLAHNVRGTTSNWPTFDSPIDKPAPTATWTFTEAGTYAYLCEVHADVMTGTVLVKSSPEAPPPPPPPPPPLSEQPFPNDGTVVAADGFELGGLDTAEPALRGVRASRKGRGAKVRFAVSEQSVVTVRFSRGAKRVRMRRAETSGQGSVTVRRLKAGRYRVEVRAKDLAGNASEARVRSITVR